MSEKARVVAVDASGRPTSVFLLKGTLVRIRPSSTGIESGLNTGDLVDVQMLPGDIVESLRRSASAPHPAPVTSPPPSGRDGRNRRNPPGGPRPRGAQVQPPTQAGKFVNPYTLVPAPPRNDGSTLPFGDRQPAGHGALVKDHWSGTIEVTITTVTPLLLLDARRADRQRYPIRVDSTTKAPVLEWTALKGALRSAFEAVTNSRFGVLSGVHERHLAIRQNARGALGMLMGRIEKLPSSTGPGTVRVAEPLTPTSPIAGVSEPLAGASVPAYGGGAVLGFGGRQSGDEVIAWVRLRRHDRGAAYSYWQVCELAASEKELSGSCPTPITRGGVRDVLVDGGVVEAKVHGYLHISGNDFTTKHDERLFVDKVIWCSVPVSLYSTAMELTSEHVTQWEDVLESYRLAHVHETTGTTLGRHVRPGGTRSEIAHLTAGEVCFLRLADGQKTIAALFPVMIGREVFPESPQALLDREHLPAGSIDKLSPADRLFGWVSQAGSGATRDVHAYRGHIRGSRALGMKRAGGDPIEKIEPPIWLRTLGEPRAQQYRFRLLDSDDKPLPSGVERDVSEGYAKGRRLARTFYWSQSSTTGIGGYWDRPTVDGEIRPGKVGYSAHDLQVSGTDRYREFLAPAGTSSKTTKAISEWVPQGVTFSTTLRLENVEKESLGVLLWLLTLPESLHFALGHGKPLGFGAVRIEADLERSRLSNGTQVAAGYRVWTESTPQASTEELRNLRSAGLDALTHSTDTEQTMLAVERVMEGPGNRDSEEALPIHYPRRAKAPAVYSYEWFVGNERRADRRKSLPGVSDDDPGLPYWEV